RSVLSRRQIRHSTDDQAHAALPHSIPNRRARIAGSLHGERLISNDFGSHVDREVAFAFGQLHPNRPEDMAAESALFPREMAEKVEVLVVDLREPSAFEREPGHYESLAQVDPHFGHTGFHASRSG